MTPHHETIAVQNPTDVPVCRRRVAHLATAMKFPAVQVGELAILVSELAENALRHGGGGELSLVRISGERGQGIEVICSDRGPGFNPEAAFADGFSTVGSLGIGLGDQTHPVFLAAQPHQLTDMHNIDLGPKR